MVKPSKRNIFFIFISAIIALSYTSNSLSTFETISELEARKSEFIAYAVNIKNQMSLCGNATLLYYTVKAVRGENDAYGALIVRPFFTTNVTETIDINLTTQEALWDINQLWEHARRYAQNHVASMGFAALEKKINMHVIHPYTCSILGLDPQRTTTKDVSAAIDKNRVDRQAYNRAMVCSQFVRYLLEQAYKNN